VVNLSKSLHCNPPFEENVRKDGIRTHSTLVAHRSAMVVTRTHADLTVRTERRSKVFTLKFEIRFFFFAYFKDEDWFCQLAYLADIVNKFNVINLQIQGFDINVFKAREKMNGFYKKFLFRINCVDNENATVFPTVFELTE
jgi:hypothetical protein